MDTLILIPFLAVAPQIDGRMEDTVWHHARQMATTHALYPVEGEPARYPARVWFYHDGTYLYIAARCPSPHGIRTENLQRDRAHEGMDNFLAVALGLPPFPASRGFFFAVNAAGALSDAQIIQNNQRVFRWDGDWQAATHTEDTVWTVEIRIPLRPLGFSDRLALQIYHQTTLPPESGYNELSVWHPVPYIRVDELSLLPAVQLAGNPAPPLLVSFLPTLTLMYTRPFVPLDYQVLRVGGDSLLQYRLGGDLLLQGASFRIAGTLLPDFANVEVDRPQILEDPYAFLYLPEKRPFFYEGLDLFNLRLRTLYTRRFVNIDAAFKGEWGQTHRVQGFFVRDQDLGSVGGLVWGGDFQAWSPRVGTIRADTTTLVFAHLRYARGGRSFRIEGARTERGWGAYAGAGLRFQRNLHEGWFFTYARHLTETFTFPTLFRTYPGQALTGGVHTGTRLQWQRKAWQSVVVGMDLSWGDLRYTPTYRVRFLSPRFFARTTPYLPWYLGVSYFLYGTETHAQTVSRSTYLAFGGLSTGIFLSQGRQLDLRVERGHEAGIPLWRTRLNFRWSLGTLNVEGELQEWRRVRGGVDRRLAVLQTLWRRGSLFLKGTLQHALSTSGDFPYAEFQGIVGLEWGGRSRMYVVVHPYIQDAGGTPQVEGAFKIAYAFYL